MGGEFRVTNDLVFTYLSRAAYMNITVPRGVIDI